VTTPEPAKHRAGEIGCDEALFEKLRQLRKQLADEQGVPPYIVFSDVALRQMARSYPQSQADFARISGVGERKLREFGSVFMAEISSHLRANPRQVFADDTLSSPAEMARPHLTETVAQTLQYFQQGQSVEEIARFRQLTEGTIYGHLAAAIEAGGAVRFQRVYIPRRYKSRPWLCS